MTADEQDLSAGTFTSWLEQTLRGHETDDGVDVPCGSCTACCRSSLFIHVEPDETETLRRIPRALQFTAPGRPPGHVVLGHDERGHCPMLIDDRCSIYEHRPRACRRFDCRVFPAAGLTPDDGAASPLTAQARRWRFDLATELDRKQHEAVRAAAVFIRRHADGRPARSADVALTAVRVHRLFLGDDEPDVETVRTALD